jgi:hypothetical protein
MKGEVKKREEGFASTLGEDIFFALSSLIIHPSNFIIHPFFALFAPWRDNEQVKAQIHRGGTGLWR